MNKKITILVVAAAFTLGGGVSAMANAAPPAKVITKTVTVPGPTVTKDVPGPTVEVPGPERIVTKTVPGPATNTTPKECITALNLADEGFSYASDGLSAAGEAMTAVTDFDVASIRAANTKLSKASSNISSIVDKYNAAKASCRDSSS